MAEPLRRAALLPPAAASSPPRLDQAFAPVQQPGGSKSHKARASSLTLLVALALQSAPPVQPPAYTEEFESRRRGVTVRVRALAAVEEGTTADAPDRPFAYDRAPVRSFIETVSPDQVTFQADFLCSRLKAGRLSGCELQDITADDPTSRRLAGRLIGRLRTSARYRKLDFIRVGVEVRTKSTRTQALRRCLPVFCTTDFGPAPPPPPAGKDG